MIHIVPHMGRSVATNPTTIRMAAAHRLACRDRDAADCPLLDMLEARLRAPALSLSPMWRPWSSAPGWCPRRVKKHASAAPGRAPLPSQR